MSETADGTARIAAALFHFDIDSRGGLAGESYAATAEAIAPVVNALAAERAAAELEAAAADIRRTTTLGHIAERLERRAAGLRKEAGR